MCVFFHPLVALLGKTLAFLLPAVEKVLQDLEEEKSNGGKPMEAIRILVISPTRELASQIDETAKSLCRVHRTLSHQVVFGGSPKGRDLSGFDRRIPVILTATPGRLIDHLESSFLRDREMDFRPLDFGEHKRLLRSKEFPCHQSNN